VHAGNLGDIGEDFHNLGFREAVLQPSVHKVDQTAAGTILHQQEYLVASAFNCEAWESM
jgi:hypothetical protein